MYSFNRVTEDDAKKVARDSAKYEEILFCSEQLILSD